MASDRSEGARAPGGIWPWAISALMRWQICSCKGVLAPDRVCTVVDDMEQSICRKLCLSIVASGRHTSSQPKESCFWNPQ
jgi:hypothetical protein